MSSGVGGVVLERVEVTDFERRTPCESWSLGDLLGHVIGTTEAFAVVLEGGATPARARAEPGPDVRAQFASAAERSLAGWSAEGARRRRNLTLVTPNAVARGWRAVAHLARVASGPPAARPELRAAGA